MSPLIRSLTQQDQHFFTFDHNNEHGAFIPGGPGNYVEKYIKQAVGVAEVVPSLSLVIPTGEGV